MIISYGGVQIAADTIDGGTDGVDGPLVKAKQNVQLANLLRSADADVFDRGNLIYPLPITITPAPFNSSGAALIAMLAYMKTLPASGALVLTEDGYVATFAKAVIESMSAPYKLGHSFAVDLVFHCVRLTTQVPPLESQAGTTILSQTGQPITPQS